MGTREYRIHVCVTLVWLLFITAMSSTSEISLTTTDVSFQTRSSEMQTYSSKTTQNDQIERSSSLSWFHASTAQTTYIVLEPSSSQEDNSQYSTPELKSPIISEVATSSTPILTTFASYDHNIMFSSLHNSEDTSTSKHSTTSSNQLVSVTSTFLATEELSTASMYFPSVEVSKTSTYFQSEEVSKTITYFPSEEVSKTSMIFPTDGESRTSRYISTVEISTTSTYRSTDDGYWTSTYRPTDDGYWTSTSYSDNYMSVTITNMQSSILLSSTSIYSTHGVVTESQITNTDDFTTDRQPIGSSTVKPDGGFSGFLLLVVVAAVCLFLIILVISIILCRIRSSSREQKFHLSRDGDSTTLESYSVSNISNHGAGGEGSVETIAMSIPPPPPPPPPPVLETIPIIITPPSRPSSAPPESTSLEHDPSLLDPNGRWSYGGDMYMKTFKGSKKKRDKVRFYPEDDIVQEDAKCNGEHIYDQARDVLI